MDIDNLLKDFRRADKGEYPELNGYSDNQIYEYLIGCGGLFLASEMIRRMNIKKGDIVLDLGCGLGTTSIFLAKKFDITVIAVDYWNSPSVLSKRAKEEGLSNRIIPVQIDITQVMPFAENYFDAIFCMNSLFMFGDNLAFLQKLFKTLKIGGTFCIGSECFNQEPEYRNILEVPEVYNFKYKWSVWEGCCSKYHSPKWWKALIDETNMIDISYCKELDNGIILWEDASLNYYTYYEKVLSLEAMIPRERLIDTILYGRHNTPYATLYVLSGERK